MERPIQYITITQRQWDEYRNAFGITRRILHVELFYTGAEPRTFLKPRVDDGEIQIEHPMLWGSIPTRCAHGEKHYRNVNTDRVGLPKWTLRQEADA